MQIKKMSTKGVQGGSNTPRKTYTPASSDTPANFVMNKTHPLHEGRIITKKDTTGMKNG